MSKKHPHSRPMSQADRLHQAGFHGVDKLLGGDIPGWSHSNYGICIFVLSWEWRDEEVWLCVDFPAVYSRAWDTWEAAAEDALQQHAKRKRPGGYP